MTQTITEKIIARHAGRDAVQPGEIVEVRVDQTWSDDLGAPITLGLLEKQGIDKVFDTERVFVACMVNGPARDIQTAGVLREIRRLAGRYRVPLYEFGNAGIHNTIAIEQGFALPGELIVGGNSHSCMAGAIGAYATGMGSTDIAAILATGHTWLEVPRTIRYRFKGKPGRWVLGKDFILHTIGRIGVAGADDAAMEFVGDPISALPMEERFSMTNMAIEAGAQNAIVEPDDLAIAYAKARARRPFEPVYGDPDAAVSSEIVIDVDGLEPVIALPWLPSNTQPLSKMKGTPIDQVYIGSCTNGWLHDLRLAAEIMKGRHVANGIRVIVIPSTTEIYKQAMREGLAGIFVEAGAAFSLPTCGPCIGAHMGVLGDGDRCLSTSNRNFRGRQGSAKSETYLCNPLVAAASAVKGHICGPDDI